MTLLKILETKKRKSDELNVESITKILKRANINFDNAMVDKKCRDEIIYELSKINRC